MAVVSASQTFLAPQKFERTLKSLRSALGEMDVEVIAEFPLGRDVTERGRTEARLLLVSSAILEFESVALGRAAAVFFPLHVLVAAERNQTRVSLINPTELFEWRLPMGVSEPMDRLVARVVMAVESVAPVPSGSYYDVHSEELWDD